ncbi:MAG: hypothetical protein M1455_00565 [Actinobacteria bacterium]|nr:hypothetical protein [Actinomycetota bacterium]
MEDSAMRSRYIVGTLAVLFLVASVFAWYLFSVRHSAEDAIANAEAVLMKAQPAVKVGSTDETNFNDAQSTLARAKSDFAAGSLFSVGNNNHAKESADTAASLAQRILDDVAQAYANAKDQIGSQNYDKSFAFYKRYPATDEANELMGEVQGAFNVSTYFNSSKIDQSVNTFEKISKFTSVFPAGKPEVVVQQAGNFLVDAAFDNVSSLELMYDQNAASAKAMEATYTSQNFQTAPPNIPASVTRIQQLLPGLYMPDEMQILYARLLEADNLAIEYESILGPPEKELTEADLSNLMELNNRLNSKLSEVNAALAAVEARYYPGTNPDGQKGFEAGRKARQDHADG